MPKSVFTAEYEVFLCTLVAARTEAGLTQQELAESLDRPQSFVSKYEHGQRRLDVVEFLYVARALGIDPHAVIEGISDAMIAGGPAPH